MGRGRKAPLALKRRLKRAANLSAIDPAVREFLEALAASQTTMKDLSEKSGLPANTLRRWTEHDPGISNFRAALQAFGWDIKLVRKHDDNTK